MSAQLEPHFYFDWRTSSYSADQGNCVEVATQSRDVLVRDSNEHRGPILAMTAAQWEQFLIRIGK
ncbi:MAG TPA: DUF397 domain-containing protein [Acidobacteriaceae bacterium]|nr:DUF397 domain-containing protein [Acidobacteriaceae bacterium]